jgi:toxin CptA
MHQAPAVTYPAGPSRSAGRWLLLAWLAGAVAIALWTAQAELSGWRQGLGAVALVCGGAAALYAWRRQGAGDLRWDGACWQAPGLLDATAWVRLDLQDHLLLELRSGTGLGGGRADARWFWAERSACPLRWSDLRRAVYSRAMPLQPLAGDGEDPLAR